MPSLPAALFRPMTLGNMHEPGLQSLAMTCEVCHHEAGLPADGWTDEVPIPCVSAPYGMHPVRNCGGRRSAIMTRAQSHRVANHIAMTS